MSHFYSLNSLPYQKNVADILMKHIKEERIHHSYIFYGNEGSGKQALANEFIRHLICMESPLNPCGKCFACTHQREGTHPDIISLFPVNKKNDMADEDSLNDARQQFKENPFLHYASTGNRSYYVENFRQLKQEVIYSPTISRFKIIFISSIEYLNDAAANAFLKLLEEPPAYVKIIMTCNSIDRVLPTLLSRSLKLFCRPMTLIEMKTILIHESISIEKLSYFYAVSKQNFSKVHELIERNEIGMSKLILEFLRFTVLSKADEIQRLIDKILEDKSKDNCLDFLDQLTIWFQDVNKIQSLTDAKDFITHVDLMTEIHKFSQRYPNCDCLGLVNHIEESMRMVNSNVHQGMILMQLSIRIQSELEKCIQVQ